MLYFWHTNHRLQGETAAKKLRDLLYSQASLSKEIFNRSDEVEIVNVSGGFILGWTGPYPTKWLSENDVHFNFIYGDIENFSLEDASLKKLTEEVKRDPKVLKNYCGKFILIHFDKIKKQGFIATPVSESINLWKSEGPNGFVVGSRPGKVLHLAGHPVVMN